MNMFTYCNQDENLYAIKLNWEKGNGINKAVAFVLDFKKIWKTPA